MNTECRSFRKGSASAFFFGFFLISTFLISFLFSINSSAQVLDSIQASLKTRPNLIGGFATKSTFIGGFRSPIFTARAGLDFDHRISFGAGVSWLKLSGYDAGKDNTPFYMDKIIILSSGADTVRSALQFRYLNLFMEYTYFKTGKWQFSIPVQFGVGDSRYKYNYNGENLFESRHMVFLYEPAVSGQFKILKWFGVGLDVGYRIMIVSNKNIGSKFNSPVYDIKALIYWGELYRAVFKVK